MKHLGILALILFSFSAQAQRVTFKWLGTSGFVLADNRTTLIFDPAITRIPLYDFLPFRTVKSDSSEVDFWMNKCGIQSVQGTFVNHAHTDHVIDAPYVVKKFGGKLYGSSSVVNVGLGQGLIQSQVQQIKTGQAWKIGDFTITPFVTPHAPHFLDVMLMDGNIEKPLPTPTSAWNYHVGETHSFLITHPSGSILFQAIGRVEDNDILKNTKADVLLLTIANRTSSEQLIQKRLLPSKAKIVIPLHYDNFFFTMRRDKIIDEVWGVKVDEFKEKLNLLAKPIKAEWPRYCEAVTIL
jgi:L-ascorbate metabolism protein UlaG (beta-lactamase superfamily)